MGDEREVPLQDRSERGGDVAYLWGASVGNACPNAFSMLVGSTKGR